MFHLFWEKLKIKKNSRFFPGAIFFKKIQTQKSHPEDPSAAANCDLN
jgi:hypothetical protein